MTHFKAYGKKLKAHGKKLKAGKSAVVEKKSDDKKYFKLMDTYMKFSADCVGGLFSSFVG